MGSGEGSANDAGNNGKTYIAMEDIETAHSSVEELEPLVKASSKGNKRTMNRRRRRLHFHLSGHFQVCNKLDKKQLIYTAVIN